MKTSEAVLVLTKIALADPRVKPTPESAGAWAEVLGEHVTAADALAAVPLMQRDTSEWPHPAVLMRYVRIVRDRRRNDERAIERQAERELEPMRPVVELRRPPEDEKARAAHPSRRRTDLRDPAGMARARAELDRLRAAHPEADTAG